MCDQCLTRLQPYYLLLRLDSMLCVQQIYALGIVYFISVLALDVVSNVGTIDDLTSTARLALTLPVAILDAVVILWVFNSLSKTLRLLQSRNATGKLQLYRRFTNALAAWVWISIAWVAYELYSKVGPLGYIISTSASSSPACHHSTGRLGCCNPAFRGKLQLYRLFT